MLIHHIAMNVFKVSKDDGCFGLGTYMTATVCVAFHRLGLYGCVVWQWICCDERLKKYQLAKLWKRLIGF